MSIIRLNTNKNRLLQTPDSVTVQASYSYNGTVQNFDSKLDNSGVISVIEKTLKESLEEAKMIAQSMQKYLYVSKVIEIDYTGILIHVRSTSVIKGLMVDYNRAKVGVINGPVGPFSKAELSEEETVEYYEALKKSKQADKHKTYPNLVKEIAEQEAEEDLQDNFDAKLNKLLEATPSMSRNEAVWNNAFIDADDETGYAMAFAETFARLVELELAKGEAFSDVADECLTKVKDVFKTDVNTFNKAINILFKVWKYKRQLKKWSSNIK